MDKFIEIGKHTGLTGERLQQFVMEQAKEETEQLKLQLEKAKEETVQLQLQIEKAKEETVQLKIQADKTKQETEKLKIHAENEKVKTEAKLKIEQENMKQEYEIAIEKLRQDNAKTAVQEMIPNAPDIPVFTEDTDNMDSYLARFERIAILYKWNKPDWAIMLSALLSGTALDVYARLSNEDAANYIKIKTALLKRYKMTEQGFRLKFRDSRPEGTENQGQFATRLNHYLDRWLEMAGVTDYENLKSLIIREQFLQSCPKNVAIHLKENYFADITAMCSQAERYLQAHGQNFATNDHQTQSQNESEGEITTNQRQRKECYNCGKPGHIRSQCRNEGGGNQQHCTKCNRFGHKDETCRRTTDFGGMIRTNRSSKLKPERRQIADSLTKIRHCQEQKGYMETLKPTKGRINGHVATTLRDTGCTTVCVNDKLVLPKQRTGRYKTCTLMDGTRKRFEIATVDLDTPYIKQNQVSVMCVKKLEFDIVVGDVPGAWCKCNPDLTWKPDDRTSEDKIQGYKHVKKQIPI